MRFGVHVLFAALGGALLVACGAGSRKHPSSGASGVAGGSGTTTASGFCPPGMLAVGGGTFTPSKYGKPMTVVTFCMDQTEVTVSAYAACVAANKCEPPEGHWAQATSGNDGPFCNGSHPKGREQHPINCLGFQRADAYCRAMDKRLPFREEWEWAAAGGPKASKHPWGDAAPTSALANLCFGECPPNYVTKTGGSHLTDLPGADAYPETSPVGSFPPENFGFFDLGGNVSEMTRSLQSYDYARGGNFLTDRADDTMTTTDYANGIHADTGFRCAVTPDIEPPTNVPVAGL